MSSIVSQFTVHNNEINAPCELKLIENPDDHHLSDIDNTWSPILQKVHNRANLHYWTLPPKKRQNGAWDSITSQHQIQDAHWEWKKKKAGMLKASHRMYALTTDDSVEAIMRINLSAFSKIKKSPATNIVYIDYLAVAPWNRSAIQYPPRYRGLGSILLAVAVSVSLNEEMEGRCGLHSLPQAEGFYGRVGMKNTGLVDAQNLKYFEFEPAEAKTFLKN